MPGAEGRDDVGDGVDLGFGKGVERFENRFARCHGPMRISEREAAPRLVERAPTQL
jgi:hypothetical protein